VSVSLNSATSYNYNKKGQLLCNDEIASLPTLLGYQIAYVCECPSSALVSRWIIQYFFEMYVMPCWNFSTKSKQVMAFQVRKSYIYHCLFCSSSCNACLLPNIAYPTGSTQCLPCQRGTRTPKAPLPGKANNGDVACDPCAPQTAGNETLDCVPCSASEYCERPGQAYAIARSSLSTSGSIIVIPSTSNPSTRSNWAAWGVLIGGAALFISTATVLACCGCCAQGLCPFMGPVADISSNILSSSDALFSGSHLTKEPGPLVVRKSRLGGAFSILALLSFAVLTVFLVLDYTGGSTTSLSLMPFGFGPLEANYSTRGRFRLLATFLGYSGVCVCNATMFAISGITSNATNTTCFLTPDLSSCTAIYETLLESSISAEALVSISLCPGTAVGLAWNISASPHYHEASSSVSQTWLEPLGGSLATSVAVSATYVILTDESLRHDNGEGFAMTLIVTTSGSPPVFSPTADCAAVVFRIVRGTSYMWIDQELSMSIAVLIAAIASYLGSVYVLFTILLGIAETIFLWRRNGRLPRELRNFQTLYENAVNAADEATIGGVELQGEGMKSLHDQFHTSATHLHRDGLAWVRQRGQVSNQSSGASVVNTAK
jgi:hypothetical protein